MAAVNSFSLKAAAHGPACRSSHAATPAPFAGCRSPLLSPRCTFAAGAAAATPRHDLAPVQSASSRSASTHTPVMVLGKSSSSAADHSSSTNTNRRSSFDDIYDSAAPMAMELCWDRVQDDLGLDEAPASDPQEWEEMVSLLSFDGEEHKRVLRQVHGANTRVEDMFASFDGDDFEAVLRAARSELSPEDTSEQDLLTPKPHQTAAPDSSSSSSTSGLYHTVCALRAAALAAEAAKRQQPALRRRKAPLEDKSSGNAWMLQVPYAVADKHTPQSLLAASPEAAAEQPASLVGREMHHHHHQQQQQQGPERQGVTDSNGSGAIAVGVQLEALSCVGMSCDSRSDGGCHADAGSTHSGPPHTHLAEALPPVAPAAAAAVAAGNGGAPAVSARPAADAAVLQQPHYSARHTPVAAASNNIVSSRALGAKASPAAAVLVPAGVTAGPAAHSAQPASTQRAVMQLAVAAAAVPAPSCAVVTTMLHAGKQHLQQPCQEGRLTNTVSSTAAAAEAAAAGGSDALASAGAAPSASHADVLRQEELVRWNGGSMQGLRRALARLHHQLPEN